MSFQWPLRLKPYTLKQTFGERGGSQDGLNIVKRGGGGRDGKERQKRIVRDGKESEKEMYIAKRYK